jgi:hypothetical protein
VKCFVTPQTFKEKDCKHRHDGGPHGVGCPQMLTQYIRNYTHIWRLLCSFIRSLKTRQAMGDRGPGNEAFQVTKNMQQDEIQQHCAVTCDEILLDCSQTYKYLTRGNQLASA